MDKRIKAKWLRALRSGKYIQGDGALRCTSDDGTHVTHCCLGVLSDIHSKETKTEWNTSNKNSKYLGSDALLPEVVRIWAGLVSRDPSIVIDHRMAGVSSHNDGHYGRAMIPFAGIAKAISEQL